MRLRSSRIAKAIGIAAGVMCGLGAVFFAARGIQLRIESRRATPNPWVEVSVPEELASCREDEDCAAYSNVCCCGRIGWDTVALANIPKREGGKLAYEDRARLWRSMCFKEHCGEVYASHGGTCSGARPQPLRPTSCIAGKCRLLVPPVKPLFGRD